jgi:hypothetical protein
VIDAREASWVSLRFGGTLEVRDVPAISKDLSGLTKEIGAPIKMLLGVRLLRELRATVDLSGRQFVLRTFEPPPPPHATTVAPVYYRGAAMVLPGAFGTKRTAPSASLLMNSSMTFPLALDEGGWEKAGKDPTSFVAVPGSADLKHGMVSMLRLGAYEIPNIPGVFGIPVDDLESEIGADLDGMVGSGLVATFRLTFADGGRSLWMEDLPPEVIAAQQAVIDSMQPRSSEGGAEFQTPSEPAGSPGAADSRVGADVNTPPQ